MRTILITGGHHNSALVVARELQSRGVKVVWVGHRHSSRNDKLDSAEYIEVSSSGIPFHDLNAAKLIFSLREIIRFPVGVFQAFKYLYTLKPSAILSFGGYLGGTVAIAGKILNIPIYLHEQTITAGRSNKLIGAVACKIYLTWSASSKYFDSTKTKVVGLPLRESILTARPKKIFSRHKPTLLVMGGKQGAHVLNQFIFDHLKDILSHYNVIHQTGTTSQTNDYELALALQSSLGSLSDSYLPLGYILEDQIGTYLKSSDYYFGRSGAHICYELALLGLPSVLVPLLVTHDFEQRKNAGILTQSQIGVILNQSELTLTHFLKTLSSLKSKTVKTMALPRNAASSLIDDLLQDLN